MGPSKRERYPGPGFSEANSHVGRSPALVSDSWALPQPQRLCKLRNVGVWVAAETHDVGCANQLRARDTLSGLELHAAAILGKDRAVASDPDHMAEIRDQLYDRRLSQNLGADRERRRLEAAKDWGTTTPCITEPKPVVARAIKVPVWHRPSNSPGKDVVGTVSPARPRTKPASHWAPASVNHLAATGKQTQTLMPNHLVGSPAGVQDPGILLGAPSLGKANSTRGPGNHGEKGDCDGKRTRGDKR